MIETLDCSERDIRHPRTTWRWSIALALVVLLLRLPLIHHPTPTHPDEVNFIAALGFPEPYPVHPPGYPLWVALGTLANAFGLSTYGAFQVWSLAASVILPPMMFVILRRFCSPSLAWWLALAAGLNPLIWFHAVTAMTYVPAATIGLIVLALCHHGITERSYRKTCLAALILVIGVFLRGDLLIFLSPLVAYSAWKSRHRGWLAVAILGIGLCVCAAVTSSLYTTHAGAAPRQSFSHTTDVIFGTSVFHLGLVDGLARNVLKIALNLAWDMGLGVVLIVPAGLSLIRLRRSRPQLAYYLILWALPCAAFLLLMHVVQGYFVLLLLALYAGIGLYLERRFNQTTATRIAVLLAVCSLCQFTLYPWSAHGTGFKRLLDAKIAFLSASGLRQIDERATIHKPGDFWPTAAHESAPPEPTTMPD